MAGFNLVSEPFIPCLMPDGSERPFDVRDALVRAHEISQLRDSSPLVTAALHRLLLAVLHRVFGPASLAEWRNLWADGKGRFDPFRLDAYLTRWKE
jgi:CRISPR system Cascade subunit CasA